MLLNLFLLLPGHHDTAWMDPAAESSRVLDLEYLVELAKTAEDCCFDSLFLSDALWHKPESNYCGSFEPLTLLSALAARTDSIGLIATASTSYYEPYHLARYFASLDHLSHGRVGWNIVASNNPHEARNFAGNEMLEHDDRYARAEEFLTVANSLWESWTASAVIQDRDTGRYVDPSRVKSIDHHGAHFVVRGPLDIQRSPQTTPLLVQAGASESGRRFASRFAEIVFTVQTEIDPAVAFAKEMRDRAAALGRDVRILPGLIPIVGQSRDEALERFAYLKQLQVVDYALDHVSMMLDLDLRRHALDDIFPNELLRPPCEVAGNRSTYESIRKMTSGSSMTVGEVLQSQGFGRGHLVVADTPPRIVDTMEKWIDAGAADGFNIMPAVFPADLNDFARSVVPILRERGHVEASYREETLRQRVLRRSQTGQEA